MPNWCDNHLTLEHKDAKMIQRAKKAFEESKLLYEFVPYPKELDNTFSGFTNDPDEREKNEKLKEENIKKYGYSNWYEFCISEWGTKWDVGIRDGHIDEQSPHCLSLAFNSAWSPPLGAYDKMKLMGFKVTAYYNEEGMGFCGKYEDGYDSCYSYTFNSETIKNEIPDEIDEHFFISDSIKQIEEMEKENGNNN